MKTSLFLTLLTGVAAAASQDSFGRHGFNPNFGPLDRRAACNADNCARAVTGRAVGTDPAPSSKKADCSSFFLYTVTPATSTITSTVTPPTSLTTQTTTTTTTTTTTSFTTSYTVTGVSNNKRTITSNAAVTNSPTAVPTYASFCSGTARYSSACSCFGVTTQYTTVATPLTTVTVTASAPSSTITQTSTTTTTSVVAQTTVIPEPVPCGQTVTGADGFRITVVCGTKFTSDVAGDLISTTVVDSFNTCLKNADGNPQTGSFQYQVSTNTCSQYNAGSALSQFATTPDPDFITAYFSAPA